MNNENPELETEPVDNDSGSIDDHGVHEDIPTAEMIDTAAAELDPGSNSGDSVEALRAQLAESEKRTLLHQADMENYRRRKSKESQEAIRYASLPLINGILEVVDNLNRALESAKDEENASALREGVEIVVVQMIATLESHGCKKIAAMGEVFDPNIHEAIQMQPDDEPLNTIVMEVQKGFMLHDRVVRPAKVIISTGPAKAK